MLVLITFGTELAGSNAIYGVSCVVRVHPLLYPREIPTDILYLGQMVVVVGISFNLIIIRVDKGIAVGTTYASTTHVNTSIPLKFRSTRRTDAPASSAGVEVVISTDVDRDNGDVEQGKDTSSMATGPKMAWPADADV